MLISAIVFSAMILVPDKKLYCVSVDSFGNKQVTVEEHIVKETTTVEGENLLKIIYTTSDGRIVSRYLVNEICTLKD